MDEDKLSYLEKLRQAFKDGKLKFAHPTQEKFFMHPADVDALQQAQSQKSERTWIGADPALPGGDEVIVSSFVERGKVMRVQIPKSEIEFPSPPPIDFDNLSKLFARAISDAMGLPPWLISTEARKWEVWGTRQWPDESLIAWGKRLSKTGWLDSAHVRWQYQKAVWRAVLSWPVRLWERIRGRA